MAQLAQNVYAEALFGAAQEQDELENVQKELRVLEGIFHETPVCLEMLSAPALTPSEKNDLLRNTLEGRICPTLYNFMRILTDNARTNLFFSIADEFYSLCREAEGIILVEADSAVALSDEQKERLRVKLAAMTGKKIQLRNSVKPELLGGIVLRFEGTEIDGSVKERLSGLRRSLKNVII